MAAERGAVGHVEGALPGLGQSGAGGGYDNGISHFAFGGQSLASSGAGFPEGVARRFGESLHGRTTL
jgi:hypothetical protein